MLIVLASFKIEFLNLCIYVQTQKYIWSRFCKLMYLFLNSELYLKYTSFQQKSRSTNEVLLKYKKSTFSFFRWGTHLYMSVFPSVHPSVRLLRSISQDPHIIWSQFLVHLCKMMIYPVLFWYIQFCFVFFIFSKFWFFGLLEE